MPLHPKQTNFLPHEARIAVVSHSHPSVSKGGGEIAAYTLFCGLRQLGVDAKFIATCSFDEERRISLGSQDEHVILTRPEMYNHFYHLGENSVTEELHRLFLKEQIEIANMHHFFNIGLGALRHNKEDGPEIFLTLHEFLAICNHHGQMVTRPARMLCERSSPASCSTCFPELTRQQFALRKRLFLSAFRQCKAYISPSMFLASRFIEWGLPGERMHVIENGLPLLHPKQDRGSKSDGEGWVIGFFGQINPFKGVDLLLKAADILDRQGRSADITFRVHGNLIGQGQDFTTRFNEAVAKGTNVSWVGQYDNSNVGRLMSACDYLLIPSLWWENSPLVIQEAYSAGLPVICSGIGGMAEKVIDGVSGLHFRVNDPLDLARVSQVAANQALYERLRAQLPSPSSAREMAEQYLAVYSISYSQSIPNSCAL